MNLIDKVRKRSILVAAALTLAIIAACALPLTATATAPCGGYDYVFDALEKKFYKTHEDGGDCQLELARNQENIKKDTDANLLVINYNPYLFDLDINSKNLQLYGELPDVITGLMGDKAKYLKMILEATKSSEDGASCQLTWNDSTAQGRAPASSKAPSLKDMIEKYLEDHGQSADVLNSFVCKSYYAASIESIQENIRSEIINANNNKDTISNMVNSFDILSCNNTYIETIVERSSEELKKDNDNPIKTLLGTSSKIDKKNTKRTDMVLFSEIEDTINGIINSENNISSSTPFILNIPFLVSAPYTDPSFSSRPIEVFYSNNKEDTVVFQSESVNVYSAEEITAFGNETCSDFKKLHDRISKGLKEERKLKHDEQDFVWTENDFPLFNEFCDNKCITENTLSEKLPFETGTLIVQKNPSLSNILKALGNLEKKGMSVLLDLKTKALIKAKQDAETAGNSLTFKQKVEIIESSYESDRSGLKKEINRRKEKYIKRFKKVEKDFKIFVAKNNLLGIDPFAIYEAKAAGEDADCKAGFNQLASVYAGAVSAFSHAPSKSIRIEDDLTTIEVTLTKKPAGGNDKADEDKDKEGDDSESAGTHSLRLYSTGYWDLDWSYGLFFSRLGGNTYYEDTASKKDKRIVAQANEDKWRNGYGAMAHYYLKRTGNGFNPGGAAGVSLIDGEPQYNFGLSAIYEKRRQRIILTGGLAFGKVNQLQSLAVGDEIPDGEEYTKYQHDVSDTEWFFSITFNF